MTRISSDDVRKVSKLARLEISEEHVETYANQLEEILEYIAQLEKIDTKNIPPTTRAVEVVNVLREDIVDKSNVRDKILDLAPNREGQFYRVPKILAE
ncbi:MULTISPECIES: Asp-tRNA(Asn)/Glu-tRNA(Gln) amidotransferase subunit GatC [Prochlorococcus]|uniref:Aspartyl/glutamyl-tRNA(Asn/Gln) amidotransferase subunit C n=1 Tax=Prochlorococcus marinus (strain SARG / CCMP1375 / SS120) TaxID=167539 RepID=GATC_PROMA|nr:MULTISPECIES: Asp-tRNA(Asn)/Glu-tRNA(Gln) amidotransferase subunit GatC [Prochlorococcus]Q7VDV3.1 RecName: Full=Aspartyl/glutamyl-tRNA(Asn/Gln) amidotransferase subunit C; Short=Asp/Glu-ADT subunit C [Prochlorococcus marinus subsp. marinus str. CCMP1375]AAP99311.1 Asp-tRNAAsn/Glu-tRNAGln amidotransferase C subunit [Prochlorococcus marinus subsp. marinus str. CCMP1375]KGG11417.1 Aspartyl-tRNA(Asn) amidotransferase subunit C Glutamyl-tRNA(Gln) amidotransferase subunit C [Prochlorococcus marinus